MDSAQIQEMWDINLIRCWKSNSSTNKLIIDFISDVAPIFLKIRTFYQLLDYANQKLRVRTLAIHEIKMPVRAFVANHSDQLSSYLWDTDFNTDLVAEHIDNFKWYKKRKVDKAHQAMKQKEKRRLKSTRYISARASDKRSDWNTTK